MNYVRLCMDKRAWKRRVRGSGDEIDIRESIKPLGVVEVCMEGKAVDNDIRMYLDWTLRTSFHMKRWEDARKQEIQQKVSAMSQGM